MPWMRGTVACPDTDESKGKRMLWAGGNEQLIWSPNSDEFWEWTGRYIVEYARMSKEQPALMGVFLDYENYFPNGSGNCYELSYDDLILGLFAKAQGIEMPTLEPARRKPWLEEQGLHAAFEEFQIAHWREKCRALRQAVDRHDPQFQFCIYPAPGTMFMVKACYPEWSTQAAPIILADPWVYGRPSRFLPQSEALESNRRKLLVGMEVPKTAGIPFIYAGGTDPVVAGADPEFCGKNTVMIAQVTDGHWIFYEGPTYSKQDHADYWKWYTWANRKIIEGDLEAWREPRENPEGWTEQIAKHAGAAGKLQPPEVTGNAVEYPLVKMRKENLVVIAARAGQAVEMALKNQPVGKYQDALVWRLYNVSMKELAAGNISPNEAGVASFTPSETGLYLMGLSAGGNAYSIVSSNAPVGLYAAEGLKLIGGADHLYFQVPQGAAEITLTSKGDPNENAKLRVLGPDGTERASGQTSAAKNPVSLTVPVGEDSGKVWSVTVAKPDEGAFEDNVLTAGVGLAPIFSLVPGDVFGIGQ